MEENPDSLVNQEVLTPGQLFLMFLKVNTCCSHPGPVVPLVEWCDNIQQYCYLPLYVVFFSCFCLCSSKGLNQRSDLMPASEISLTFFLS